MQVTKKAVKGLIEDVVSGSKWLLHYCSFDDNFNNLPQLTKTEIMSPTDIPYLVCYICTEYDASKGVLVGRKNT